VLVGIALILFNILTAKAPTPQELADRAECLLGGHYGGYDVDDYEHLNPKDRAYESCGAKVWSSAACRKSGCDWMRQRKMNCETSFEV
jgi:hypothetical protein